MTSISKDVYIEKLGDIVAKYNNQNETYWCLIEYIIWLRSWK